MKIASYYDAKLGCGNCGLADFYKIPRGYEFLSYENEEIADLPDHVYSRIRKGVNDKEQPVEDLDCRNCRMPFLELCGWEKNDLPPPVKAVSTTSPLHH